MSAPRNSTLRISGYRLQVNGLRELRAALRDLDAGLPKELQSTNKRVVNEVLVPRARGLAARTLHGSGYNQRTHRSRYHWADVINSIRGTATQTSASILLGSTARTKNWMLGYEFGSLGNQRSTHGNTKMFPPWRGSGTGAGYFFFPTIRQSGPEVVDAYATALQRFVDRTIPEHG
jgi:hypothetical protein